MRILQSIGVDEVDESNPDYIQGKQQNGEWLKNKFEAIYAKFEAMPDMMSDEVDMRGAGSIVVDRGHMRKLDKEYRNRLGRRRTVMPDNEVQLIDDMFANDKEMRLDEQEEVEDECGERDELAPSQSPEPVLQKSSTDQHVTPLVRSIGQNNPPVPNTPTNATLQATLAASVNPAADLLQIVQFPQTPAGQQARKAFEAQTAQAVQQAVASIFSSLLSNVPTLKSPRLSLLQAPETPAVPPVHTIASAPATAPSLYRPPPAISDPSAPSRSSPVPVHHADRRKRRSFAVGVHIKPRRHDSTREDVPLFVDNATLKVIEETASEPSVNKEISNMDLPISETPLERSEKPRRGFTKKKVFTAEDDQYIIESRVLHKRPWADIINSRPRWRSWNKSTFWKRWCNKLSHQAAEMERSGELALLKARCDAKAGVTESTFLNERPEAQPQSSPSARHLPTPSSLGHDEYSQPDDEPDLEKPEDLIASGGHFDDDEKDLLSLCGDRPRCNAQADPLGGADTDSDLGDAREIPETPLNLTQETSSQVVLQSIVTREATADVASSQTAKAPPKEDGASEVVSTMDTTHMLSSKKPSPKANPTSSSHQICPLCRQTFPTAALLQAHITQPHPREIHITARAHTSSPLPVLPSTPLASATGQISIKHEPTDTDDVLSNLLSTPTSVPHPPSSTGATTPKSASKLPRAAYNAVKRSWARGGRGATPVGKRKRQSLGKAEMAPRKRFWDEVGEGSEDELGM